MRESVPNPALPEARNKDIILMPKSVLNAVHVMKPVNFMQLTEINYKACQFAQLTESQKGGYL